MPTNLLQILLPKGKGQKGGRSFTPTYNSSVPLLRNPTYRDHLTNFYNTRQQTDSRDLLNTMFNQDPDVSAAVHAYLTIAEAADLNIYAYDLDGVIDPDGIALANQILDAVTTVNDYTVGYSNKPSRDALTTDLRYMALLRGSIGGELIFDKTYVPTDIRIIDTASLWWFESAPGVYAPQQRPRIGPAVYIDLNIPTFFTASFHQNPTDIYTFSLFVSAINTIAARTEVINELYRIMRVVGYPRLDVEVLEEVIMTTAPASVRGDPKQLRAYVEAEVGKVASSINAIRSDQALVHSSAVKAKIINDKAPGASMNVEDVIRVLDSQNQAALKVMPAVIGRSDSTGQVAGTEARLFALGADALNNVVADLLSQVLTLATRLAGFQGKVVAKFRPVELRPVLELEPQLTMRAARLKQDLSLGLISDLEYHMEMYGRPPPPGSPPLSGTNFLTANADNANVDVTNISPNADAHGRSLTPSGSKAAKSNATKSGETKPKKQKSKPAG